MPFLLLEEHGSGCLQSTYSQYKSGPKLVPFCWIIELQLKGLKLVLGGNMENQKIKNDANNTIGKNIREARLRAELGQTELVSKLQLLDVKMTRETLVKIERGVQHIQLEQLKAIKQVLEVSYEELLD